jgi:hypothetical protein
VKAIEWQRLNQKWSSWTDSLPLSLALFMKAIPLLLVWATIPFLALLCSGLGQMWLVQADRSDKMPQSESTRIPDPAVGELTLEVIYPQQLRLDTSMPIFLWLLLPEGDILSDQIPDYLLTIQTTNSLEAVHFSSLLEGAYSTQYRLAPTQRGMPPTILYAQAGQQSSYWTSVATSADLIVSSPVTASLTLKNMRVEGQVRSQWRRTVQFLAGTNALVLALLTAVLGFVVQQWRYLADLDQAQKKGKLEAARQEITWLASQMPKNPSQVLRRYLELKEKTDFPWTDPQIRAQLEGIWDQSAPEEVKLLAQILLAASNDEALTLVTQETSEGQIERALIWGLHHLDESLSYDVLYSIQLTEKVFAAPIYEAERQLLRTLLLQTWSVSIDFMQSVQISSFRQQLRRMIDNSFNQEELHTLCSDLNIDYEHLPGNQGKENKVRALIEYAERRGRLTELLQKVVENRPNLDLERLHVVSTGYSKPTLDFRVWVHNLLIQNALGHHRAENDPLLFNARLNSKRFDAISSNKSSLIFGASGSGKTAAAIFLAEDQWEKLKEEVFFPVCLPIVAEGQPENFLKDQLALTLATFLLRYLALEPRHFLDLRQRQAAIARLWGHCFGVYAYVRLRLHEAGLPDFGYGQHLLDRLEYLMGDYSFSESLTDAQLIELISACYPAGFAGLLLLLDWQPEGSLDIVDRVKKYLSLAVQLNRRGVVVKFFLPIEIKQPLLAHIDLAFLNNQDAVMELEWDTDDLKSLLERRLQLQKNVSVLEELCDPDVRALNLGPQQRLLEKIETPGEMICKANELLANLDDSKKLTASDIESWLASL